MVYEYSLDRLRILGDNAAGMAAGSTG